MPQVIPEWPQKFFISVYMALYKERTNAKLTAADSRAIQNQLPIYIDSYFLEAFGDTETLQGMQDLESRPLAEMADINHKGTNLRLAWTAEDTAAA